MEGRFPLSFFQQPS